MSYMKYKAFLKVVELNSFTKAGKCLGYTQSAISQMLNSLEQELNANLLFRNKSGIKLTNEGIELLPFIKDLCGSYDILNEIAVSINSIDRGIIKIGLINSVTYTWFCELMSEFKDKYPNVKYELTTGNSKEIQDMVKRQTIDFGITYSPVISELIGVKLMSQELCLIGAKSCSINNKITIDDLSQLNFICSKDNEDFNLLEKLASNKVGSLQKCLEAPDFLSSIAMAENNLGLVVTNSTVAEKFKCNIKVINLEFDIKKEISVVLNDLNRISRTGKCFLDLLVEKYCN